MAGPTDATRREREQARPRLLALVTIASTTGSPLPCPRCTQPMHPWHDLDVGHTDDVATGGAGSRLRMEHRGCNRGAGGALARGRTAGTRKPAQHINTREW